MKTIKVLGKTIPVVLLIAIVLVGTVSASYAVWSQVFTTTVMEPIEVTVFHEPETNIAPGLGYRGLQLHIHNTGSSPLTITVTKTCNAIGDIVFANWGAGYCDAGGAVFGPGTMTLGETFTIYQDGQIEAGKSCYVTVQFQQLVPADCPPGDANIQVTVSRG